MLNPNKNMMLERLVEKYENKEISKEEFKVFLTNKLFRNRRESYRYKAKKSTLRHIGEVNSNLKEILNDEDYIEYLKVNGIEVIYSVTVTYFMAEDNGGR